MGSCVSSSAADYSCDQMPTAKVVLMDGSLLEFSTAVEISQVLGLDGLTYFLCDSDSLCYDSYIQAMSPKELVIPGQLYFVLPIVMLERILSGPEMAALAVKASSALANIITTYKGEKGSIRIMPLDGEAERDDRGGYSRFNEFSVGVSSSRSMWMKKTMKSAAPLLVKRSGRPFEVKLSAIEEVAE